MNHTPGWDHGGAVDLSKNYLAYMQNAEASYDTMVDNILLDWGKPNTLSYAVEHQCYLDDYTKLDGVQPTLMNGSRRYFYGLCGSCLPGDSFYKQSITDPSKMGSVQSACDGRGGCL